MRAREALDAFLGDDVVEEAAGAAIGVRDEDPVVPGTASTDALADRLGDATRSVVEGGRQARDVDVRQAARQRDELACERATADDEDPRGGAGGRAVLTRVRGHVARR